MNESNSTRPKLRCHFIDVSCIVGGAPTLAFGYLIGYLKADAFLAENVNVRRFTFSTNTDVSQIFIDYLKAIDEPPNLVAFTSYFWNLQVNIKLSALIKRAFPHTRILLGGNEVTNAGVEILSAHPEIDFVISGEGEVPFASLLATLLRQHQDLTSIPSLTFRDPSGGVHETPLAPRIADLNSLPSPFTSGVFSAAEIASASTIVYEFSRGCPFACAFCYWGAATNTRVRRFSFDRVLADLDVILDNMRPSATLFLADANFAMTRYDTDIAKRLCDKLRELDKSIFFFANWSKNTSERVVETAKLLFNSKLMASVTLSAQSMAPVALEKAKRRNIPVDYYRALQRQFLQLGIPTYTELILGLPGETLESFWAGVDTVFSAGGHPVVYPLLLLRNTEFFLAEARQAHGFVTRSVRYQFARSEALVDVVVGTSTFATPDLIGALGDFMVLAACRYVLCDRLLAHVHERHGVEYSHLARAIRAAVLNPASGLEECAAVLRHFEGCWSSRPPVNDDLIRKRLSADVIEDQLHYQAFAHAALADEATTRKFVELVRAVANEAVSSNDRETLDRNLTSICDEQIRRARGMRRALHGDVTSGQDEVRLELAQLRPDQLLLSLLFGSVGVDAPDRVAAETVSNDGVESRRHLNLIGAP
jgi:radical SAM superfamily enzyme YgiQ (UPF0313 family)